MSGGNVVHISAGIAGLVTTIIIGKGTGYGQKEITESYSVVFFFNCYYSIIITCCCSGNYVHRCLLALGRMVWIQCWFCSGCKSKSRVCNA